MNKPTSGPKIRDIATMPTNHAGSHESVLRGYQILEAVKYWLEAGVPNDIVLQLIAEMERKASS